MIVFVFQSTHSQGVRLEDFLNNFVKDWNFNPRTHKECDELNNAIKQVQEKFQSTHSQGVRQLINLIFHLAISNFNPRTHKECDTIGHQSSGQI